MYQFTSQLSDTPPWYASQWSYDPSHRCSTTELEYVEVPSQLCVIRLSHCHLTLTVMLMQVLMKLMQSSHSRLSERVHKPITVNYITVAVCVPYAFRLSAYRFLVIFTIYVLTKMSLMLLFKKIKIKIQYCRSQ